LADLLARHYLTGEWLRIAVRGTLIAETSPVEPAEVTAVDEIVAPAIWDIQTNGRWGVSFSDPMLTPAQVADIIRAQAELGTARVCPTLITAPFESFRRGLKAIAAACESDPVVGAMVAGIHLEGPYISPVDGYRGAHPYESVREPDWDEFQRFQEASGGRVALMTLAPEHPGTIEFIQKAVDSGVAIAIGHTSADGPTLRAAAGAGASLSTHLGNGIASPLTRHPNPIWEQAALDGLFASFIADGHHIDPATLKVLVRAKTPGRVILVSDASPLAGLPPGAYGPWEVHSSGKILVAGTHYLAGSNQSLATGINMLINAVGLSVAEALATVTDHPARLLGRPSPRIEPGEPSNLVVFRLHKPDASTTTRLEVVRTCVDGIWTEASDATRVPESVANSA
jgi:N-acetylglucosamine-6-phosphate deacetylase